MAKLIYTMFTSLDGYTEDEWGNLELLEARRFGNGFMVLHYAVLG